MTRLAEITSGLRAEGTKALVPFLTAGYPDRMTFHRLTAAVAASGCRLMELGVPFSDPVADGPVIQAASRQALDQGVTLTEALTMAGRAHREHGLEIVLMGYLNPILHLGPETFAEACRRENVAGVIVPDLPSEEAAGLRVLLADRNVTLVDLVAPTTTDQRLEKIAAAARGFLYLVAVTGVTGAVSASSGDLAAYLDRVARHGDLPRYVGFGVSTPEQAAQVCAHADGVIIGSALLRLIARAPGPDQAVQAVAGFLHDVNQALGGPKG